MTVPGARREPMAPARVTIGRVIDALKGDFPDITPSKVRFLEEEGLISPHRTASGYRTYSGADVDRLRRVLRAQRDGYLPLRVIRDALDAGVPLPGDADHGPGDVAEEPSGGATAPTPRPSRLSLTPLELCEAAFIDRALLAALESFGLLAPDRFGRFDRTALEIATAAGRLAAHGLEARHLRPFRAAADREAGLVQQVLATRRVDATGASDQDRVHDVLTACLDLHAALLRSRLHGDNR